MSSWGVSLLLFFFFVLRIPARGRFIRPLEVAGERAKYLIMSSDFMKGIPLNWSFLMALRRVGIGAFKND